MNAQKPDDQEIRQMLSRLHAELEKTQTLDDDERALMVQLMADIQEILKRSSAGEISRDQTNKSFVARLEGSIDLLEVNHPELTAMVQKALETLSIAGI
jgi:fructose-1-phosphate kinase PfkB-like protein